MKLASIVGARPQFIKAGPISQALAERNRGSRRKETQELQIHTGQHYDYRMSQVFYDELGLKAPSYHLGVGSGPQGAQTGEMLERIEEVLLKEMPDMVLVYGDTNSSLAGALAAAKLRIPVIHVEAGVRSFNRAMAEEINRVMIDHLSVLLFAPTETAVQNLRREGITDTIHRVGDVMYDAVIKYRNLANGRSRILEILKQERKAYGLATVHRAENTDHRGRLRDILCGLEVLSQEFPIVFPVHPRTRQAMISSQLVTNGNLILTEPVSYLDMLLLESEARLILTDSGGVQKEAYFFRVPCITLRDETEWVETVKSGWNTISGTQPENIVRSAHEAKPGRDDVQPFGDGTASRKIAALISAFAN